MSCPFDLQANKNVFGVRPHKKTFLKSFKKQYGITDPAKYFLEYRKRLLDRAEHDDFGVTKYETLEDWWDAQVLAWRYGELPHNAGVTGA